jgi:hypothetical protein
MAFLLGFRVLPCYLLADNVERSTGLKPLDLRSVISMSYLKRINRPIFMG